MIDNFASLRYLAKVLRSASIATRLGLSGGCQQPLSLYPGIFTNIDFGVCLPLGIPLQLAGHLMIGHPHPSLTASSLSCSPHSRVAFVALMISAYNMRDLSTSISVGSGVSFVLDSDSMILPISFTFDALLFCPDLYSLILARHSCVTLDSCSCCIPLLGE